MQPTLVQVPPGAGLPSAVDHSSTQAVCRPSCAARMAAMYPPGPPPMTTTSNVFAIFLGGGRWKARGAIQDGLAPPAFLPSPHLNIQQDPRRVFQRFLDG